MRYSFFYLIIILLTLCSGCGYRFQEDFKEIRDVRVSIPYIKGDYDGRFTDELIKAIASSTPLRYVTFDPEWVLKVEILSEETEQIGYRYDREEDNNSLIKHLSSTESRRTMTIEVTLFEQITENPILGPELVTGSSDYDYVDSDSASDLSFINPAGQRTSVLTFSLGQLDSNEGAQDAALIPLYRSLAKKVVDGLLCKL
jgi:hypothetical protein